MITTHTQEHKQKIKNLLDIYQDDWEDNAFYYQDFSCDVEDLDLTPLLLKNLKNELEDIGPQTFERLVEVVELVIGKL